MCQYDLVTIELCASDGLVSIDLCASDDLVTIELTAGPTRGCFKGGCSPKVSALRGKPIQWIVKLYQTLEIE